MLPSWASAAAAGPPPWILIYDTDKAEGGLMVLFFGLVFSVGPPVEIFLSTSLAVLFQIIIFKR